VIRQFADDDPPIDLDPGMSSELVVASSFDAYLEMRTLSGHS
jgi:hypothetical protein